MAWVDCLKAYDMVPHSWILESLTLVEAADNVVGFITRSTRSRQTELTAGGEILGSVNIVRGIFRGDFVSPLLYCDLHDSNHQRP